MSPLSSPSRLSERRWVAPQLPTATSRRFVEICDRYELLFIADEVMTGWGRTGLIGASSIGT